VRFNNVFFEKYPKKSNLKFVYYYGELDSWKEKRSSIRPKS
jgi:hypothetical protein